MKHWKITIPAAIVLSGFLVCGTATYGKPEYTKQEKKACSFCHATASAKDANAKELTDAGKYYKEHHTLDGYKK
jgi:hypothetical protein